MITNFYKNVNESFLAAHFALRNTKFGGGGKIGIGKRGRAKIPGGDDTPTPFLFARPSIQFLPSRQRREQSIEVSFEKGSSFVQ